MVPNWRRTGGWILLVWLLLSPLMEASGQPAAGGNDAALAGNWRGTATAADGATTAVVLALADVDGVWTGTVSGFEPGRDAPLTRIEVTDGGLLAETEVASRLGPLVVRYDLTLAEDGDQLTGTRQVIAGAQRIASDVELQRRRRRSVPQPQVERRIGYFAGTWTFDYTGGEYPPLSIGTRSGRITFTPRRDSAWVDGVVTGEVYGEAYEEQTSMGFDADSQMLVVQEQLSNGVELLSLGDWRSPIGIDFRTRPVEADGRMYQLRRLLSVTSDRAFRVTEEFSVDGGPFRRLGNANYQRVD